MPTSPRVPSVVFFDLDGTLTDPKPGITGCIQYALERLGEPEDIALGALYLASPASAFVTGAVMDIHGGITSANLDLGMAGL